MKRGRKPKPTELKRLAGNPGGRPLNEAEPRPPIPAHTPRAPRWLNAEAKREWRRVVPILKSLGLYTVLDRTALAMLCQAIGRWIQAERELAKEKLILVGAQGGYYQNPKLHVANKAWEQTRKMLAEFGLTPSNRTRLVMDPPEGDKSIAEQLFETVTQRPVTLTDD